MVPSIYGENMFDDFFDGSFFGGHSPLFGKHARNLMKTDIRETDDAKAYRFAVELPGFEKDEIHVDVQDGYLTVSAEKGLDKDEENKKGRVLRQERYSGACSRSFYVGDVKPEDVKAKYESGVLTVLIPKEEPKKLTFRNRKGRPPFPFARRIWQYGENTVSGVYMERAGAWEFRYGHQCAGASALCRYRGRHRHSVGRRDNF